MRPPQARVGPATRRRAMPAPRSAAGNRRRIVHLRRCRSWQVVRSVGRETTSGRGWFPRSAYHAAVAHPLVDQLRFTRSEWLRALDGIPEADGVQRIQPMNSIGWIVSHLAWHEQLSFLTRLQDVTPVPAANEHGVNGKPASTPPLSEAL